MVRHGTGATEDEVRQDAAGPAEKNADAAEPVRPEQGEVKAGSKPEPVKQEAGSDAASVKPQASKTAVAKPVAPEAIPAQAEGQPAPAKPVSAAPAPVNQPVDTAAPKPAKASKADSRPEEPKAASRQASLEENEQPRRLPEEQASKPGTEKQATRQESKPAAASASPGQEPPQVRAGAARPVDPTDADDVLTKKMPGREAEDATVLAASRKHTRRSFLVSAVAAAAGFGLYKYLDVEQHQDEMQPNLLRKVWDVNAAISRAAERAHPLTPTYPLSRAETLRVNGLYGVQMALVPGSWRLQMTGVRDDKKRPQYVKDVTAWEYKYTKEQSHEDAGHDSKIDPKLKSADKMAPAGKVDEAMAEEDDNHTGRKPRGMGEAGESDSTLPPNTPGLLLTMDDILKFPRHELVTQFKCIEGWSQIVHWAGIRLADFLEAYPPALVNGKEPRYVYMETPDGDYYNGYDIESCRHPQALLVTEMMGAPLTQLHGAPLRVHMPTKYGYKQIKRIGLISYTDEKPDDYWTKLGYDWYGGL